MARARVRRTEKMKAMAKKGMVVPEFFAEVFIKNTDFHG